MMTFSRIDLAGFFAACSRADVTAEQALKDLEARNVTQWTGAVRRATPRALCDSVAQKAGRRLSDLTSHDLADLLRG